MTKNERNGMPEIDSVLLEWTRKRRLLTQTRAAAEIGISEVAYRKAENHGVGGMEVRRKIFAWMAIQPKPDPVTEMPDVQEERRHERTIRAFRAMKNKPKKGAKR